jgi:hypothetical protein
MKFDDDAPVIADVAVLEIVRRFPVVVSEPLRRFSEPVAPIVTGAESDTPALLLIVRFKAPVKPAPVTWGDVPL